MHVYVQFRSMKVNIEPSGITKLEEKQLESGARGGTRHAGREGVPRVSTPCDDDEVLIITRLRNRVARRPDSQVARFCLRREDKFPETANGVSCPRIHLIRAFFAGDDLGVTSHQAQRKEIQRRAAWHKYACVRWWLMLHCPPSCFFFLNTRTTLKMLPFLVLLKRHAEPALPIYHRL